jgi:hypothetical protein
MALTTVGEIHLQPAPPPGGPAVGGGATVSSDATLRDALSIMMADSLRPLRVVDDAGAELGYVSIELINKAMHNRPTDELAVTP